MDTGSESLKALFKMIDHKGVDLMKQDPYYEYQELAKWGKQRGLIRKKTPEEINKELKSLAMLNPEQKKEVGQKLNNFKVNFFSRIEEKKEFCIFSNIALAVAFCRIHYRRQPGAIPKTMEGRAKYWKKFYNSELGRGTPEHYMKANLKNK